MGSKPLQNVFFIQYIKVEDKYVKRCGREVLNPRPLAIYNTPFPCNN